MSNQRTVLHIDLDAFFASVEQRDYPNLRGKPVIVGGSSKRGVVAACSYEARKFGIRSAMPMMEAIRRCPAAVIVPHRMERYAEASQQMMHILDSYSPRVEPLSLDEAFVELTGTERLLGNSEQVADSLSKRVFDELRLTASIGIAPIKFAAKIASDINKPHGICIVKPEQLVAFLTPLPLEKLWGAGPVATSQLHGLGLRTIGDVAKYPKSALIARFGDLGEHFHSLANGLDTREVSASELPQSVGHRETFDEDCTVSDELVATLLHQIDRICMRLRRLGVRAQNVALIIKYDDFREVSKRKTMPATSYAGEIIPIVMNLLTTIRIDDQRGMRVRLCGVAVSDLVSREAQRQLEFENTNRERETRLGRVLDELGNKFGSDVVTRATTIQKRKS